MKSSVRGAFTDGYLEPLSDNSEIDMTSDTEAEGPTSRSSQQELSLEEYPDKL